MSRLATVKFIAASTTFVSALQTTAGAGAFLINGTGADVNSPVGRVILQQTSSGFSRPVTLTSAGNVSGVNFTIKGTDIRGAALSEVIAGPNANTVATTNNFYTVTSITVSGAVGTNTSAGIGTTGISQWIKGDYQLTPVDVALQAVITAGTINYTAQRTLSDVELAEPTAAEIFGIPSVAMSSATTSQFGDASEPFMGIRCIINSSSAGGALTFKVLQAGIV